MKKIKCELCGSGSLIKENNLFVCQHCGTMYSVEEARNLLQGNVVVAGGNITIDNLPTVDKHLTIARDYWENGRFSEAAKHLISARSISNSSDQTISEINSFTSEALILATKFIDENKLEYAYDAINSIMMVSPSNSEAMSLQKNLESPVTITVQLNYTFGIPLGEKVDVYIDERHIYRLGKGRSMSFTITPGKYFVWAVRSSKYYNPYDPTISSSAIAQGVSQYGGRELIVKPGKPRSLIIRLPFTSGFIFEDA